MATGPSSTTDPYLVALEPNVTLKSIITAGNVLPGSTIGIFAGTPDGGGAYDNGDGTFTLLINHEFGLGTGAVRDHGGNGSFVDELIIRKSDLAVISGHDLIQKVYLYNTSTDSYDETSGVVFSRFCSSDLADQPAYYNSSTGLGTSARIYMTGEEDGPPYNFGDTGRAIAVIATGDDKGNAYELARFGNAQWENLLANPYSGDRTVVIGQQDGSKDGSDSHVYVYIGEKQSTGSEIDKAGLTNGSLWAISVDGLVDESNSTDLTAGGHFSLVKVADDASDLDGAGTTAAAETAGATSFLRPEDGAWDPTNHNRYYFVTTNSFSSASRLWALDFVDSSHPELGGTITELLDGSEGQHMFDNITVDADTGHVLLQEDPGGNDYVAQGYDYDPATDTLTPIYSVRSRPVHSGPCLASSPTTRESSGIFDATSILGDAHTSVYLLTAQVHLNIADPAIVQGGQLLAMYVRDPVLTGGNGNDDLFGSQADETLTGGNGKDVLNAGSGNDILLGGNGKDILIGGADDDVLTGGNGKDWFIFDNLRATGADEITDFGKGDLILLTESLGSNHVDLNGSTLDLFSGSTVDIDGASALHFNGMVQYEGISYFTYELAL